MVQLLPKGRGLLKGVASRRWGSLGASVGTPYNNPLRRNRHRVLQRVPVLFAAAALVRLLGPGGGRPGTWGHRELTGPELPITS